MIGGFNERANGMPWKVDSLMIVREEFVVFARQPTANIAALCRRFGISRKTGYKWMARRAAADPTAGTAPLIDRSRRPACSPDKTSEAVEQRIVELRLKHPAWGARKIKRRLEDLGQGDDLPARSTINDVLRRHGLIDPAQAKKHAPFVRFERAAP